MNKTSAFNILYYRLKPFIPRRMQLWARSNMVNRKRKKFSTSWPILDAAGKRPENWPGWPGKKNMAVIVTHDVESSQGVANCLPIAQMEMSLGFRSSFNFVARRYPVPDSLLMELKDMGFEIGVHGVYHDGKLFQSRHIFRKRAQVINQYLEKWGAIGFRAPAMHHNLEWLQELEIAYDLSTFDTDPFEPQSDGVSTIFPFWVGSNGGKSRYLEMPYTLTQDFTLFILMKEKTTRIWRKKLDWIRDHGGMALVNTHPDYMAFEKSHKSMETYPAERYWDLLKHVKSAYEGQYWHALPKEMVAFYDACCPR